MAYFDTSGKAHPYPVGLDRAKQLRSSKFMDEKDCPECGKRVRYTHGQACVKCAQVEASDFYAYCVGAMHFEYLGIPNPTVTYFHDWTKTHRPFGDRDVDESFAVRVREMRDLFPEDVPASRRDATKKGVDIWVRPEACAKSGHFGIRNLEGFCYFCDFERKTPSPRKLAIAAGKTWYTPTKPCPRCGTLAERNVHNGACKGCKPNTTTDGRKSPDVVIMENYPDMVIAREAAKRLGMKVYRTGEPCRRKHTGFRYVSTGNCIECLRGSK